MKIQIVDSHDQLCFRTDVSERFAQRLAAVLSGVARPGRALNVVPDVELDLQQTTSVLEALQLELRELARDLPPASPAGAPLRTEVLDQEITLDLRLDAHVEVKQLNDLVCALRVSPDRFPLSVLVVPRLSSRQFYLLRALKSRPDGIERSALATTLQADYEQLMRLPIITEELRTELRRQAATLSEHEGLAADIEDLRTWGLLEVAEESLLPTRKLLRLRL